jgi:hypothetical protein
MKIKLLDQVRETPRLKHLSRRTEEAYVQWIHPVRCGLGNISLQYN